LGLLQGFVLPVDRLISECFKGPVVIAQPSRQIRYDQLLLGKFLVEPFDVYDEFLSGQELRKRHEHLWPSFLRAQTLCAPLNKVVVAIANKLARIAWAVLSSGRDYRHQPLQPAAA